MGTKEVYLENVNDSGSAIIDLLLELTSNQHAMHQVLISVLSKGDDAEKNKLFEEYAKQTYTFKGVLVDTVLSKYKVKPQ